MEGAKIVRDKRLKLGLSLKALAEKVNVSYVLLDRIERGMERRPSEDLVQRLVAALDYEGDVKELTASFENMPEDEELTIVDHVATVERPAFFKPRRAKKRKSH